VCKIEVGTEQSRAKQIEYALPGLEHHRRGEGGAADSAAGTGAGMRAGHDRLEFLL
jgi:hypothetical protein